MNDTATVTETSLNIDFPSVWGVRFLNDDFTPMEFVIAVLIKQFNQKPEDAFEITMRVHEQGEAVVGSYTKDVAQTKAYDAVQWAKAQGHPLRLDAVEI